MNYQAIKELEEKLLKELKPLAEATSRIREVLTTHANGKSLKGDEVVGWLGEIQGKLLLGGTLVGDDNEHDFVTEDERRVSVKARRDKGGSSWKRTSGIPKIEGDDCPTHLLFVRLDENYLVKNMWLYEWASILKSERFKSHKVRGLHRAYFFEVNEPSDKGQMIYPSVSID
ncbi:MAG: hypothetical protein AB7K68_06380 [Bacteriovoracia bacterium]